MAGGGELVVQSTRDEIFALFGASVVGLLHDPQRVLSMRRCDVGEALRENVERPGAQGRPPPQTNVLGVKKISDFNYLRKGIVPRPGVEAGL